MSVSINGNGSITGLSVGGLPDGSVDADSIAAGAVTNAKIGTGIDAAKLADGTVTSTELQYINSLSSNAQTQIAGAGNSFVIGNSNRAMSTTGTQTISGLGITPSCVYILGVRGTNHEVSWGFSNSTAQYVMIDRHGGTANAYTSLASFTVSMYETNTVWFKGSVGNFADGSFDIVWTKNGSPAGTCYFGYLAIGS